MVERKSAKHYLVVFHPFWGHIKPLLSLVVRLLRLHSHLEVTFVIAAKQDGITHRELERLNTESQTPFSDRITWICYGPPSERKDGVITNELRSWNGNPDIKAEMREWYRAIVDGKEITDSTGQQRRPSKTPVTAILFDEPMVGNVAEPVLKVVRETNTPKPELVTSSPCAANWSTVFAWVDAEPGLTKRYIEDLQNKVDPDEALSKNFVDNTEVVHIAGCEPMYAFEIPGVAGRQSTKTILTMVTSFGAQFAHVNHTVYHDSPYIFGSSGRSKEEGHPCSVIGPFFPLKPLKLGTDNPLNVYLDDMVKQYGERSVGYVGFGSLFFTPTEGQIPLLIRALVKRGRPVVTALSACPEDKRKIFLDCVNELDDGAKRLFRIEDFIDQPAFLTHPAIEWFLTHAGLGSISEAIVVGVPMIFWPNNWDQPLLANALDRVHKVGIELVQCRIEQKGRKLYRGTVVEATDDAVQAEIEQALQTIGGPTGQAMRTDIAVLRDKLRAEQVEGGAIHKALLALGDL